MLKFVHCKGPEVHIGGDALRGIGQESRTYIIELDAYVAGLRPAGRQNTNLILLPAMITTWRFRVRSVPS